MALTEAQVAAYAKLDDAIDAMVAAFDGGEDDDGDPWMANTILVGYVLIVGGARFQQPTDSCYDPDDDEQDMVSVSRGFTKRGQQPLLTRGILEAHLDRYRNS